MSDEKLPEYLQTALNDADIYGDDAYGVVTPRHRIVAAIHRFAREREAAAVAREDDARRSPMPVAELALEPPSVVALSKLADEAVAHGWDEASGDLYAAARDLSSAHCNLKTCSEALAGANVRPSNIKWARQTADALRALIHKEPANG